MESKRTKKRGTYSNETGWKSTTSPIPSPSKKSTLMTQPNSFPTWSTRLTSPFLPSILESTSRSFQSVDTRLYCRIKRYRNKDFMSGKITLIQMFSYVVFLMGLMMYVMAVASSKAIQDAFDSSIWAFNIIFTLFIIVGSRLTWASLIGSDHLVLGPPDEIQTRGFRA